MGQACGIIRYNAVYEFEPNLSVWRSDFEALQFTENDIGRLYRIYNKIDNDRSGLIDYLEMLNYLDIDRTAFAKRVFTIFDEDGSGKLDFKEFVMSLWNYCTLSKSTLVLFAYDIYDKDSSGEIEGKEVQQMLTEIYGKGWAKNAQALAVSKIIESDLGDVDLEEFKEFSRNHPAMLFPAFHMQQIIHTKVLGESFWQHYSNKRIELSKGEWIRIHDFMEIHIDKDFKKEFTTNVVGKKLNKKTLEIIENTGSASRRNSKVAAIDQPLLPVKKSIAAVALSSTVVTRHPEELFVESKSSTERRKSFEESRRKSFDKDDDSAGVKTNNSAGRRKSFEDDDSAGRNAKVMKNNAHDRRNSVASSNHRQRRNSVI